MHSSFVSEERIICGMAICSIKTKMPGPAQAITDLEQRDIIDEALDMYRVNLFFKNYEVLNPADVNIIYLTVFINHCIRKIQNEQVESKALQTLLDIAKEPVPNPDQQGFFLKNILKKGSPSDGEKIQAYIKQLKDETCRRLIKILYYEGKPSFNFKFWIGLSKKDFMQMKY